MGALLAMERIMHAGVIVQTGVRAIGMIMQASVNVQLSARSPRKEDLHASQNRAATTWNEPKSVVCVAGCLRISFLVLSILVLRINRLQHTQVIHVL